mgnify:CR=1 FL=1
MKFGGLELSSPELWCQQFEKRDMSTISIMKYYPHGASTQGSPDMDQQSYPTVASVNESNILKLELLSNHREKSPNNAL